MSSFLYISLFCSITIHTTRDEWGLGDSNLINENISNLYTLSVENKSMRRAAFTIPILSVTWAWIEEYEYSNLISEDIANLYSLSMENKNSRTAAILALNGKQKLTYGSYR